LDRDGAFDDRTVAGQEPFHIQSGHTVDRGFELLAIAGQVSPFGPRPGREDYVVGDEGLALGSVQADMAWGVAVAGGIDDLEGFAPQAKLALIEEDIEGDLGYGEPQRGGQLPAFVFQLGVLGGVDGGATLSPARCRGMAASMWSGWQWVSTTWRCVHPNSLAYPDWSWPRCRRGRFSSPRAEIAGYGRGRGAYLPLRRPDRCCNCWPGRGSMW
jgi:hypothetical protein